MSETYAESIAVVLPVIVLAAAVEMRSFEKHTRKWWSEVFEPVIKILKSLPHDRQWTEETRRIVERRLEKVAAKDVRFANLRVLITFIGTKFITTVTLACFWAGTTILMGWAEIATLIWLGNEPSTPDEDLAALGIVATILGLGMLLVTPVVRVTLLQVMPLRVKTVWQVLQQARRLYANRATIGGVSQAEETGVPALDAEGEGTPKALPQG